MTLRTMLVAATVAVTVLPGCGGPSAADVIDDAEASLRNLTSGTLDMRLVVGGLGTDSATTGFEVSGPFALPQGDELPKLDLTYTQIAGDEQTTATITSTGDEVFVTTDGITTEVAEDELAGLRGSSKQAGGLEALGLGEWFIEPSLDGDHTVEGELNLAAAMTGLARFSGALGATDALGGAELDDDAARRLQEAVTSSQISLSLTEDRLLQRLAFTAELETDADVPDELRGGRFDFELSVSGHNQPVTVATPPQG